MDIAAALKEHMSKSSSADMEDTRDRLRVMLIAGGEETRDDPLAFLYQDMYDAIEVLDTNIEGAYKEEKIVQENKRLDGIFGK
jgi:hypothetical protein